MQSTTQWLKSDAGKVLIAGPCSAESAKQMLDTALGIAARFPNAILRAGSWKPRTRPGNFEGSGVDGLKWLKDAGKEAGLKTATEVATPQHVEAALTAGIDIFWIGARTTGNPFLVQELAESLRGTGMPVLVKNPLHPDLQLWIGGIERFQRVGIENIAAIHRGFHAYENSGYRNVPRWQLVHALKSIHPELPVICDISHIAGSTSHLMAIAQQAYDLDLEGLMIETHVDPANAMSDSDQQVDPETLFKIVNGLTQRVRSFDETNSIDQVGELRSRIDKLDLQLLDILVKRVELIGELGDLKRVNNVSVLQLERWKEIIDNCMSIARANGLNEEFVRNVFLQIHDEAIRLQSKMLQDLAEKGNHDS
ncbi:MAG: chorismate mutase [Bacteroidota bacterium]